MKPNDEFQNNGKTKLTKPFSVLDEVFDNDLASTSSEMTSIESVHNDIDSTDHNINTFESHPEIIKLKSFMKKSNSSHRKNLHILRSISLQKENSIIIGNSKTINKINKCLIEKYDEVGLQNSFENCKYLLSKKLNINMNKNEIIEFFNDVDPKFLLLTKIDEEISDKIKINLFGSTWIEDNHDLINVKISYLNDCEFIGYNPEYKDFCKRIKRRITGL